jgi:hypothetical protein
VGKSGKGLSPASGVSSSSIGLGTTSRFSESLVSSSHWIHSIDWADFLKDIVTGPAEPPVRALVDRVTTASRRDRRDFAESSEFELERGKGLEGGAIPVLWSEWLLNGKSKVLPVSVIGD